VRWTITALVAAVATISAVAVVAVNRGREAAEQRDIAISRQLAANAVNVLAVDPLLSLALAMRAYTAAPTAQAEQIVRQATAESRNLATLRDGGGSVYSARSFADGRAVVSTGADGALRIWDVATKRVTARIPGHEGVVTSVRISPNGQQLASSGADGSVALIEMPGSQRRVVVQAPPNGYATTVDYSPDGRLLAAALSDGTVRLVDTASGQQRANLRISADAVYRVAFSGDGRSLVTAGADGTAQVWSVATGTMVATMRGHDGPVLAAVFHPTEPMVITAGADGTLRMWDSGSGAALKRFEVDEQELPAIAVSPDGRRVAIAGEEGLIRLWTLDGVELATFPGHAASVFDVAFTGSGQLISAGTDGTTRIWAAVADTAAVLPAAGATYSPDAGRIGVCDVDGHVRVLSADTLQKQLDLDGPVGRCWLRFSPDGTRLAATSGDGTVHIWSAVDGRVLTVLRPHETTVWAASFDRDGRRLLSSAADGTLVVTSLVDGTAEQLPRQPGELNVAVFSPTDDLIATAGTDGVIRLWDADRHPRQLIGHDGAVRAVAFSPDGSLLASAGVDGTVRVWRRDGTTVSVLRGHRGPANGVEFTPDGVLASVGDDGTARFWEYETARLLLTLQIHSGPVATLDVASDGRGMVTVSQEDRVLKQTFCEVCGPMDRTLELARSRNIRELTPEEEQRYVS
jgi:WD40 repeat protein